MAKKQSMSKGRIAAFIEAENQRTKRRSCAPCRLADAHPEVNEDITEWVKAFHAGEAGGSSWSSFVKWLSTEYKVTHSSSTWARHTGKCLELDVPVRHG